MVTGRSQPAWDGMEDLGLPLSTARFDVGLQDIVGNWEFPKIGVPYFGDLIIRILLFRVLYWGPLFLETPN